MAKTQLCTIAGCGERSIPGLIKGAGKCQYHYNVGQFGKEWADKQRANACKQKAWVGKRIEIPVHYDLWAQGARYGRITAFRNGKNGQSDYFIVRMEHPQVKKPLKLWRIDWDYIKETKR